MAGPVYTAKATVAGGRIQGHGRSSDGALEVDIRIPEDLGGEGGGTNPEQLFAVGYAACFESALGTASRRKKLETGETKIDSEVSLVTNEKKGFDLAVELDVSIPELEGEQAAELVRLAHTICPYSNATRGNVEVKLRVNGEAVD